MYHMKPYTADFVVEPAKIMYHMSNYHEYEHKSENLSMSTSIIDNSSSYKTTDKCISNAIPTDNDSSSNQNQVDLIISRLLLLRSRLDQFINKEATTKETTPGIQKTNKKQEDNRGHTKIIKNDKKAAKKILRKEDRNTAKFNSKSIQREQTLVTGPFEESQFKLTLFIKNSPYIAHANVQPTISVFPIHNYECETMRKYFVQKKITCILRNQDKAIIKLFNQIGQKRRVKLETAQGNFMNDHEHVYIEVIYNDQSEIILSIEDEFELYDEQSIWKFIGSLLGLYSSQDSFVSALSDKWTSIAILNSEDICNLSRLLSSYLASTDFLCSPHAILLADIVLRSKFQHDTKLISWQNVKEANNVQLWIQRIDTALNFF